MRNAQQHGDSAAINSDIIEAKCGRTSPEPAKAPVAVAEKFVALSLLLASLWFSGMLLGLN